MIGRRAARAIAEAYSQVYVFPTSVRRSGGSSKKADFFKDELYDFLYVNDFAAWLMNSIKGLSTFYNARALTEYIMGLHTADSVLQQTPDWTPKQRTTLGQRILRELAEVLIRSRQGASEPADYDAEDRKQIDAMQTALELDGYVYRAGVLYVPEESVLDEEEEAGVLDSLFTRAQLPDVPTISHHLRLSTEHYHAERWDDSISNSRKVLEGVLQQIASRHAKDIAKSPLDEASLERPVVVRDYLEKVGLLDRKEKEAVAKTYGLLSDTGGQLKANLGALYVTESKAKRLETRGRRHVFERLFPRAAARGRITSHDIDDLVDKFEKIVARVRDDRDKTLAHMYERKAELARRLVTPRAYGQVFERLERLLNDIRVIAFDSSRSYSDQTWANSKTVAEDLVDLVTCGTIYQVLHDFAVLDDRGKVRDRYYWQLRREFHARQRKRRRGQRNSSGAG